MKTFRVVGVYGKFYVEEYRPIFGFIPYWIRHRVGCYVESDISRTMNILANGKNYKRV